MRSPTCPTTVRPRSGRGPTAGASTTPAALELASGVDLLLHDGFLLAEEVAAEAAFGHAAVDYAIGLGRRAGARRVMLTHHKPGRTDAALDELAAGSPHPRAPPAPPENHAPSPGGTLPEVIVAAEGEIIEL